MTRRGELSEGGFSSGSFGRIVLYCLQLGWPSDTQQEVEWKGKGPPSVMHITVLVSFLSFTLHGPSDGCRRAFCLLVHILTRFGCFVFLFSYFSIRAHLVQRVFRFLALPGEHG